MEILHPPSAAILKAAGINCENETAYAFEKAGARSEIVHLNELRNGEKHLKDYQIAIIPGGFSYGDDIASGRVFALELQKTLSDSIYEHAIEKKRPLLGICNGFQVLIQTGLLPFGNILTLKDNQAVLDRNVSGRFESRWINLKVESSAVCFDIGDGEPLYLPVAHGEGRFLTNNRNLKLIENDKQVVFRYCDVLGNSTQKYPHNPNGSINAIAGICDPNGNIFGLMPHPERYVEYYHHPNWRRNGKKEPDGLRFFQKLVSVAKDL